MLCVPRAIQIVSETININHCSEVWSLCTLCFSV